MIKPADYWRVVCAPKVRARKREIGRSPSNTEIAAQIEAETGKPSGRQLVEAWFAGRREPFISQFFALCAVLTIDPMEVLAHNKGGKPLVRLSEITDARQGLRKLSDLRNRGAKKRVG